MGGLLEIPLPPYFPVTTTYANTQTYVGLHNDLTGLQGGSPGEYLHLTQAEKDSIAGKASLSQITFGNLLGFPSDNTNLDNALNAKQDALSGSGFVKASGGTITYDPNTYLQTIAGIEAGGDLVGFYPDPTITNSAVINKALNGFDGSATWSAVTSSDTVITAIQKLNAYAVAASAVTGSVNSVALTLPDTVFTYTDTPATGPVMLSGSFINQTQNRVFAGPESGGTGQPSFRALVSQDLPATGIGIGTVGATSQIPVITYDNYGRITNITTTSASNGGVVDTVGFTVPAGGIYDKTIGGTTTDPVINFQVLNQDPNKVYAGPPSGTAPLVPTFRSLVAADIPTGIPQANIQNLSADLNSKLGAGLTTSLIYMGNGSGVAAQSKVAGDLTAIYSDPSGINTATFTIANKAVTYAKFADVPDSPSNAIRPILLGRFSSGQGPMQQMTLDPLAFNYNSTSGEIGLLVPNPPSLVDAGDLLTSSGANVLERLPLPVDYATKGYLLTPYVGTAAPLDIKLIWGEVKGDITYSIDTTTTPGTPFPNFVIGANKVTLGKIQTIATNTILGNNAVSAAIPEELSVLDVVTMLPLQDALSGTTKGVVPASNFTPASGKSKDDYYLSANNGWELAGSGGGSPGGDNNQIQYKLGTESFGGTADMEYISGTGVYVTAANFFLTNNAASKDRSINFNLLAINDNYTWAFPDAGSEFVGTDVSQTLTNKTLSTGSAISIGGGASTYDMWYSADSAGTITKIAGAAGNIGKYLKYTSTGPSWEGVSVTSTANIDGGAANQILYQTDVGETGFIVAPTTLNTYLKWTSSGFAWDTAGSGSGTVGTGTINQVAYYNGTTAVTSTSISGTNGTKILSQAVSGGVGSVPSWLSVTGTGDVVLATSPTLVTPVLGTPASGNFNSGSFTWPTFNQNTTGSAASLTTARTILTDLASTTAGSFNGTANINVGVTGTLPIARGGTNTGTVPANGQILIGNGTGYAVAAITAGAGINVTNGAGTISISSTAASPALNNIVQSTGSSSINNVTSTIQWNWLTGSNTTTAAFVLNSTSITTGALLTVSHATSAFTGTGGIVSFTSTAVTTGTILSVAHTASSLTGNVASFTSTTVTTGSVLNLGISGTTASSARNLVITNTSTANSTGRGLDISITGNNPTSANSFGAVISINRGTGTSSTNTALQLSAQGTSATNYALDVINGISRFAAGTATFPQLILTPSLLNGGLTGTTNGSIWYDTNTTTSTSSLYLYKDTTVTRLITKDRNEDFAIGTSFGVIVANTQGSLFKSADLTALGIYAQTNNGPAVTGTTATSIMGTSIVGSTTLPANFFAAGKTIVVRVAGTYQQASSNNSCTISLRIGGTNLANVVIGHNNAIGSPGKYWSAEFTVTARGSGSGVAIAFEAKAFLDVTPSVGTSGTPVMGAIMPTTAVLASTTTTNVIDIQAQWDNPSASNIIQTIVNTAYYLN